MAWPFARKDPSAFLPIQGQEKKDESPKYIDETRFNQALDEVRGLNSKLDQMTGLFTGFLATPGQKGQGQQAQQAQEPPIDDVTDDEYSDAVLKGDAEKISKRMSAVTERKAREIRRDYDQRISLLERQGMGILEQVSGEVGQGAMNTLPYYQLLKADIDAALKQLPVHQRTPEMRAHIYHATVGANLDKVKAHDAAETVRVQAQRDAEHAPGRQHAQDQGPSPATIFGEDILRPDARWRGGANLWGRMQHGRTVTPDGFAQNYFHTKDIQEASVYASNVMALDDCPRCFGPLIGGKCHCRSGRS